MKKEMMYSLAIRKRESENDFFWGHDDYKFVMCRIDTCGRYWFADPFLFEKDNITYIFFEAFDLVEHKGKIGYSIFKEDGSCSKPIMVIDETYHLSFPYIFEKDGDVYIMPESSADYNIKIYKAAAFPNNWVVSEVLNDDIYACDSVFLNKDEKQYLLANRMYHYHPKGTYKSCWVKNYLFAIKEGKTIGDGLKVGEGDFGFRNAGKAFTIDGSLYRIGQDCRSGVYGKGLVLFRIDDIVPYKEVLVWNLDFKDIEAHLLGENKETLCGVHTYNFSAHYEIIDYTYYKTMPFRTKMVRYLHLFKKLMRQTMSFILG